MFEKIQSQCPKARHNYQLAQKAFNYTLSVIDGSSNRLSEAEKKTDSGRDIIRRLNLMRDEPIKAREYTFDWIHEIALLILKYRVGNCCEKACSVFNFIYSNPDFDSSNLELFNNPFLDHFFVVIGRDPATDPTDPRTWNIDTIFCDPWIEDRSYFLGEIDFGNLATNKREVINYLVSHSAGSSSTMILHRDVLGKANGNEQSIIVSQSCMVLRTQFYEKKLATYNVQVPMFYEIWDLPTQKHYHKHHKQHGFFSPKETGVISDGMDSGRPSKDLSQYNPSQLF